MKVPCFSLPRWLGILLAGVAGASARGGPPVDVLNPYYKYTQTLVASADLAEKHYLAFPIGLRVSASDLLIGFKRGFGHAFDATADFDLIHFNPITERVEPARAALRHAEGYLENAEFVRFANGDISCYVDVQKSARTPGSEEALRLGLIEFRSTDGGRTFQPRGKLGRIAGVEYGYAFEAITEAATTWMLVMTFANLPGGKSVLPSRPRAGAVAVIRSDDNGRNWNFVKDLTAELKTPINESTFARYRDGFILVPRTYVDRQPVAILDRNFNLLRQTDLLATHDFVSQGIGRPRVFARDGAYYILARHTYKLGTAPAPIGRASSTSDPRSNRMKLGLFRLDPESLAVTKQVILDNAENHNVIDAYYGVPFWQEKKGQLHFNVITYKRVGNRSPDIVRFEFLWDEIK